MLHPSFFVALHYNHDWMKHLAYLVAGFILFAVLLYACSSGACFEDTEPKVIVNMYTDGTETLRKCDSIKVIGHGTTNDILLVDEKSVSVFSFSLDPLHNESTFYFNLNGKTDTVTLTYNNYPHVISPECGYTIYNDILTAKVNNKKVNHIIVNITIDNKSVTLNGERNLRLFY